MAEHHHPGHSPTLIVIGDSVACGAGSPPGLGFMDLLTPELQARHVQVENWSHPGATAVGCSRQIALLQRRLQSYEHSSHLYVVIELGKNDRMLGVKHHDLEEALDEIIHLVVHIGAHPIILELIPDGIEHHLHHHWHIDKYKHCDCIKCPDEFRVCMLKPKAGHMPTMVDNQYLAMNMVDYNPRGHAVIARDALDKLIKCMHLPREKPVKVAEPLTLRHGPMVQTLGEPIREPKVFAIGPGREDSEEEGEELCSIM